MIESIQRHLIYFRYYFSIQLEQIFGYWVFGMAFGSLVSVFGKEKIHKMFMSLREKKLGVLGVVPASLIGIASPLCMYGTIPIAASFAEKGMEEDWLAAFMMSSVLLNPQLLFYSAALGMPALIIRFVSCFLCGAAAGITVRVFFKNKPFFNFTRFVGQSSFAMQSDFASPEDRNTDPNLLLRFLKNFGRNIKATALFFLAGIILSALFQCYVPQESFARLFGNNNGNASVHGFGVLMAATIGVPLYMCGGGTIPLLQTWLHNGMSMGSAASFMITGPATKITNLGALKMALGIKHFVFYLLFAVIFALLSGLIINWLIYVTMVTI